MDLIKRPRRLRAGGNMRRLVRETALSVDDLIYPLFVVEGEGIKKEIPSMPGVYHLSIDNLLKELDEVQSLGIPGVLLFGVPDVKDEAGTGAYSHDGIVQRALREAKRHFPELLLVADVCLCEYTSHGHCGMIHEGKILNDASVELIARAAVSYAEAGADIVAPSDMMDGRVGAIRKALDRNGMEDKAIMAYSAKYASAFYGPFRDAAHSAPAFGDRKTYQMDCGNKKEALREVELDIAEGADIVMVKPAMAYLDIINEAAGRFDVPVAAYNVSGEYSMIKAAAQNGWLDEKAVVLESMTAIKRAGAKIIITYFAKDLARWIE
ncbi:MAG: porphobilinogen synthase [Clostridiales bacterium]|jgi:porphobilinogen synthase|nr:porphobilinogen synthase [Eubacteriales bacterium]MDH7565736.1 porphobilinogen synthase [Clostridiales bacterium]